MAAYMSVLYPWPTPVASSPVAQSFHFVLTLSSATPLQAKEALLAGGGRYQFVVDKEQVREQLEPLVKRQDLSRYVL
jgi:hypothetical protein